MPKRGAAAAVLSLLRAIALPSIKQIMLCFSMRLICTSMARRYRVPRHAGKLIPGHRTFKGNSMRVVVVVAAMLFCMAGCSRKEIQKSVAVEPRGSVADSIGMELIEIPAGKFTMGSPAGETDRVEEREAQVSVTLTKPFGLGKYEVTQGQWKSVMDLEPWLNKSDVRISEDNAATYVSWDDATEFCKKLTDLERKARTLQADEEYRLPTEAEWEYACRAGTTTAYSFGDDESKFGEYAWFFDNTRSEQYPHKVGTKKPNVSDPDATSVPDKNVREESRRLRFFLV